MMGIFHPLFWLLVGPALIFAVWASSMVKSTFLKYDKIRTRSGMTGAQAAAAVVRAGGGPDVKIERARGFLTDHYDPQKKTLRLSPAVYDGRSVSAVAVAAHEAGHAIQHADRYEPLELRSHLVGPMKFGSNAWFIVFVMGLMIPVLKPLIWFGILMLAGVVLFQFVTVPVEYDASRRAKAVLAEAGIVVDADEAKGVEKVLDAAALTYVAGALTSLAHLVYFLIVGRR